MWTWYRWYLAATRLRKRLWHIYHWCSSMSCVFFKWERHDLRSGNLDSHMRHMTWPFSSTYYLYIRLIRVTEVGIVLGFISVTISSSSLLLIRARWPVAFSANSSGWQVLIWSFPTYTLGSFLLHIKHLCGSYLCIVLLCLIRLYLVSVTLSQLSQRNEPSSFTGSFLVSTGVSKLTRGGHLGPIRIFKGLRNLTRARARAYNSSESIWVLSVTFR